MFIPRKVKHRKWHRGSFSGISKRGVRLSYGSFGLKALSCERVNSRQLEAARRAITHYLARGGKLWIRIFPDRPVTYHGNEMGMGKGKGSVDHFVSIVKPGRILFEIDGIPENLAKEAFRLAASKLPVRTKFISSTKI